jgi:hypothetical protein
MQYKIIDGLNGSVLVQTTDDGIESFIPSDPANSDYQQYLKWVEENND